MSNEVPVLNKPGRERWAILGLLMLLCFTGHFNRASITSAGDERIMKQFGIAPESMGMIYSAFLIVYTIFMIPAGYFIDRRGPKLALFLMLLASGIFCALTGSIGLGLVSTAHVWISLLMVRALMGLFNAPLHPGAARAVGNWFPEHRQALANGLITGASILAYALVHPIFGGLIDAMDWPGAFVVTATFTIILCFSWQLFGGDGPAYRGDAANRHSFAEVLDLLRNRKIVLLTLSYSAIGYFQYIFFYWLHFYFDEVLKMSKADSRFYAGLPSLAMAFSMPLGGWLCDYARSKNGPAGALVIPKAGMLVSAALLLAALVATERFWIVGCFTASLGVLGLCEAAFWTEAVNADEFHGGTAAAIMNTGGNGVGLLAPVITPYLGAWLGWKLGIGVGAVVAVAGAFCWFGIRPGRQIELPSHPES